MSFLNLKYGSSQIKRAQLSIPKERMKPSSENFQPNKEEMKRIFEKFDYNKDGKISKEEYKLATRALGKGNFDKAFRIMDSDRDGYIDFNEFMEVQKMVGKDDIEGAFRTFDLDKNGKISAKELMEVMGKLGERCSLKTCQKMVKGVDKDGDGLIDMNEFMIMMTSTSKD